jgi:hypothetical protein
MQIQFYVMFVKGRIVLSLLDRIDKGSINIW